MRKIEWVEEPFEIEIRDGAAVLSWPNGTRRAVPLAVFRMQIARGTKALADFDKAHRLVPLGRLDH